MLKVPQVFKNIQGAMNIYNYHHLQALKTQSLWDLMAKYLLVVGFGESKFIR
jgi:hypothetical protein